MRNVSLDYATSFGGGGGGDKACVCGGGGSWQTVVTLVDGQEQGLGAKDWSERMRSTQKHYLKVNQTAAKNEKLNQEWTTLGNSRMPDHHQPPFTSHGHNL